MENTCHAAVSTPGVFSDPGLLEALLRWSRRGITHKERRFKEPQNLLGRRDQMVKVW